VAFTGAWVEATCAETFLDTEGFDTTVWSGETSVVLATSVSGLITWIDI
jgi:hypothetical protein